VQVTKRIYLRQLKYEYFLNKKHKVAQNRKTKRCTTDFYHFSKDVKLSKKKILF